MNNKKILFTMIFFFVTASLFSQSWGDDGDRNDDDWNNGYQLNQVSQDRFLTTYPGIKTFIDGKTAEGATILEVELERSWSAGITGEVAVVENNAITVYYVNTATGAVISQFSPPASAW